MARNFRISVLGSNELMRLLQAMSEWDRETKKQIRQQSRRVIGPAWQQATAERSATAVERAVLGRPARVAVSDQNVTLRTATSRRPLSGGLRPNTAWKPVEFGANIKGSSRTSPRGRRHRFMTGKQFRRPNRRGYVFYPAAAEIIPRVASLWVQTAVRTFHELREKANP